MLGKLFVLFIMFKSNCLDIQNILPVFYLVKGIIFFSSTSFVACLLHVPLLIVIIINRSKSRAHSFPILYPTQINVPGFRFE